MNGDLIISGIVSVLVIAAVLSAAIGVMKVKRKLRKLSRDMFGTDSMRDVYDKVTQPMSEAPRSLRAMTSIYLPMINKDFPEFDYELYKSKAQTLLRSYFNAISAKNVGMLSEECSNTLKNSVIGIIEDLNSRNVTQHFDQAVMHDTQISRYIKDGKTVTIIFEISVGYITYITNDSNGAVVFGNKDTKKQTVFEVGLMYVQDESAVMAVNGAEAFGIHCPNCGAPITNIGNKFCEYCGSAVSEVNVRAWKFNLVREETIGKKQY